MPEENLKSTVKVRKPDDKAQDGDTAGIFWADIAIVKRNKEKIETDVNDNLVEETSVRTLEDAISLKSYPFPPPSTTKHLWIESQSGDIIKNNPLNLIGVKRRKFFGHLTKH